MIVPDMPCCTVVVTIVELDGASPSDGAAPYITTRPISRPITNVPIAIPIGFFFVSDIERMRAENLFKHSQKVTY